MTQSKSCEGCRGPQTRTDACGDPNQVRDCTKVYEQLGCGEGPPVTRTALVAFLLPILLFVAGLGGFGWLVRGVVAGPHETPLALVLALVATAGMMLVVHIVTRPHRKN